MDLRAGSRRPIAASVAAFALLAAFGLWVVHLVQSDRTGQQRELTAAEAGRITAAFQDELFSTVNLARGLRAFVIANPDLGDPGRVDDLLAALFEQGDNVRNIGLAPNNVITWIHPLEGNEAALGLDYAAVPAQYEAVQRAMQTGQSVLAGPVELVQGGRGLIDRTPVFLDDGTYWGIVSLVIDIDGILDDAEARVGRTSVRWALANRAGVEELDDVGALTASIVRGEPSVFDAGGVVRDVEVPGGTWALAAVPAEGGGTDWFVVALRVMSVVAAAALSLLGLLFVQNHRRVAALSLRDPLTGLPNRRLLEERFVVAAAGARRDDRSFGMLYLDLDRFKPINDEYGHEAGDHVLIVVAQRIQQRVRATDTVARVGGDEFVVLLPQVDTQAGLEAVAAAIEAVVSRPVEWSGRQLSVGTSVGTGSFPADGADLAAVLQTVDQRMYDAKRARHGTAETTSDAPA